MATQDSTTRNDVAFVEASQAETEPRTPTHYTATKDQTSHEIRTVNGHREQVDVQTDTDTRLSGEFDNRVMELVHGVITEREERENIRANRRNRNRFVALVFALVIGLLLTYVFTSGILGHTGKTLQPYAFVITILLDASVVGYAYWKHY